MSGIGGARRRRTGWLCAGCTRTRDALRASIAVAQRARYFAATLVLLLLCAETASAQEEQRAGLVVVHGDGRVVTQCVAFAETTISGADLLARSALDVAVEASGMGATVCRLDGEGCDFPAESCFCQCQGSPCIYWSYWRLNNGEWQYSNGGAGNTTVQDGAVEGWRWGLGTVEAAAPPPDVAFADICDVQEAPAAQTAPAAPITTSGAPPASNPDATAVATAALLQPGVQLDAQPDAAQPTTAMAPQTALIVLGSVLIALPLAALLVMWGWRARRRGPP